VAVLEAHRAEVAAAQQHAEGRYLLRVKVRLRLRLRLRVRVRVRVRVRGKGLGVRVVNTLAVYLVHTWVAAEGHGER